MSNWIYFIDVTKLHIYRLSLYQCTYIVCMFSTFQVHQFERELDRLKARQKTEMEQKLKQMMADEKRLLKHIKDKHDNDMKSFVSDQKAAYKAAKNQFKKVCTCDVFISEQPTTKYT